MPADVEDEAAQPAAAWELVLALFGLHVFGLGDTTRTPHSLLPLSTKVFLWVFSRLDITDTATRSALNRMVHGGMLSRDRQGRTSVWEPTEAAVNLFRQGRDRIFSPAPFDHADALWTVLSCPLPETLRNVRYHVHGRLAWAGFGALQANLWVAPGQVDVQDLLGDLLTPDALSHTQAFHGIPTAPSRPDQLVRQAWDLDVIRRAHHDFLARWETAQPDTAPAAALPQFLLLLDQWARLLRTDPGLPAAYLDDWPAGRSARTFQRLLQRLGSAAEQQLHHLIQT
jgi:phenylacetic acid degradation operon negative regulatory protein